MKIIIDKVRFDFNDGIRVLKMKYKDICPYPQEDMIASVYNEVQPLTFIEICQLTNVEQRRLGFKYFPIDDMVASTRPKLIDRQIIKKQSNYVNTQGELVTEQYDDVYELYKLDLEDYAFDSNSHITRWRGMPFNIFFVSMKDTSTDRQYRIWVDYNSIQNRNTTPTAIDCIAWTITTNIKEGYIDKIIRQGDCIMVKPTSYDHSTIGSWRHLSADEYLKLIVAES